MTGSLITAISWERVHLSLTVLLSCHSQAAESVQFVIVDGKRVFPVKTTPVGDGQYRISINVTNFRSRAQVPNGTWRIVPLVDGDAWPPHTDGPSRAPTCVGGDVAAGLPLAARYDLTKACGLDEHSRVFLFADNRAAYVITFGLSEDDEHPEFLMRTYLLGRRRMPDQNAAKPPLGTRASRKMLPRARRRKLVNLGYRLSRLINPPRGNRILFASERRTGIEGNLARVRERMIERGLDRRCKLRYCFRIPSTVSGWNTLRTIYLLATSDIVLIDDHFGLLGELDLSPETKIIQLWHAGSGFKSIGYSRFGSYGSAGLVGAHRKYTYAIAGSKSLVPVYAEAFGIEQSAVVATGLPRIDTFLNAERTQKVVAGFFEQYPNLNGKRIILFAPTFRGRGIEDAHYDYARIDFGKLYEMCGERSVVLFRMHHFVTVPVPIPPEYADRLLDFKSFPETNDLLHVADVLITDYSSVIYEFSLLNKPMLFYAYDKEAYSAVRGFHRDYDATAPGKVCSTFDELVKALQNEDYDMSKLEAFQRENFDYLDTGAADRVIDWLILDDPPAGGEAAGERACPDAAAAAVAASPSAAIRGRKP
jgi:CDP-ribitol ribitolphosphotransferase / teichoic acid ribitol-phosphate polymerase